MYIVAGPNGAGKSTLTSRVRRIVGVDPIDADAIQRETGTTSGPRGPKGCAGAVKRWTRSKAFSSKRRSPGAMQAGLRHIFDSWRKRKRRAFEST
jgi:predicted ABC-type ATPase